MFKNPQSNIRGGNQIIFSDFLNSVENGEVLKVEIQGNNIKGVYSNGNSFSTYSPNDPNLIEKLSKIFEQGLVTSKDLADELTNILKSKRDEVVFKMKLTGKDEFDILSKRVEILEKKLSQSKSTKKRKTKQAKRS